MALVAIISSLLVVIVCRFKSRQHQSGETVTDSSVHNYGSPQYEVPSQALHYDYPCIAEFHKSIRTMQHQDGIVASINARPMSIEANMNMAYDIRFQ